MSRIFPADQDLWWIMRFRMACWVGVVATSVAAPFPLFSEEPQNPRVEFNRDVRPILSDKCYFCHGPDGSHRKGELRLDTSEGARASHDGIRAIVPGKPSDSELVARVTSQDENERMPPPESGKVLTRKEIETLTRWIAQGADYQPHWSYCTPVRPAIPEVHQKEWPLNPVDHYLMAQFEARSIQAAPDANRTTLIRRLTLDLTGLLPSVAEVQSFVNDQSPDAYEKVVDRLLASPHFGERLAMYWLDLVRYADTVGYHGDQEHAITPYRDYVIDALNSNMPFDQFTREQIAGDLLPDSGLRQKIASGYNRLLQTSHEGGVQVKEYLHKYDADRVRNLSSVWLGATLGCAECHNHKYDPYTQKSFYQIAAFFADVDDLRSFNGGNSNPTSREPEIVVSSAEDLMQIQKLEQEIKELQGTTSPMSGAIPSTANSTQKPELAAPEDVRLKAVRQQLEAVRRRGRRTMVTEAIRPKTVRVLYRGDWMDETGEIVEPAVPDFLPQLASKPGQRLNRIDLANWLTSRENPLTARVFTNRMWYLFLGAGLANSLDDFGAQGEWPTHPELLDWLSLEFVDSGWNIKHLVRMIVTSHAYRQASEQTSQMRNSDPENRLFARQSQFRLPAEMIRDNALQVSGLLAHRQGASSHPYQPAGYYKFLNFPKREYQADLDDNQYRRGVYVHWQRQYLHPMLRAFDASTREECTVRRPASNTPLAALTLLNDPTFLEAARSLAARVLREGGDNTPARITWVWSLVLLRSPSSSELSALRSLYETSLQTYQSDQKGATALLHVGQSQTPADLPQAELAAWTNVCRALLNLHETIVRN